MTPSEFPEFIEYREVDGCDKSVKEDGGPCLPDHFSRHNGRPYRVLHGDTLNLGTLEQSPSGDRRGLIELAAPTRGIGVMYLMSVEELRGVGQGMIEIADELEAEAGAAAATVLLAAKVARP